MRDEIAFYTGVKAPEEAKAEEAGQDDELALALDHFGLGSMKPEPKLDPALTAPIEYEKIDQVWQLNQAATESDEFQYSPRSHPFYRVLQTLTLLAEIKAFKLQNSIALEIYEYIEKKLTTLFPTDQSMQISEI